MSTTTRSSTTVSHDISLPMYVIYSRWSFVEIITFLAKFTSDSSADIGPMKVDYNAEGVDTNRTFVMLSDAIVQKLIAADLDHPNKSGFSFSKYRIKDDFKLAIRSLCVPIPRNFNITGTMVKNLIEYKLSQLFSFGVASQEQVKVVVPLFKREDDTPRGAVYINFDDSVADEAIAVIKNMLHNTYWDTSMITEIEDMNGLYIFNCHYARTSPFRGPASEGKEVKSFYKRSN